MGLRHAFTGAILLLSEALPLIGAEPDAQRRKAVISYLDLERLGLAAVKNASVSRL